MPGRERRWAPSEEQGLFTGGVKWERRTQQRAHVSQRHRHTSDEMGCRTETEKSFPAGDGRKLRGCDERRCPHAAPRCWHRSPAVPSPCPGPAGHWQSPPAKNCKNCNRNQALLMTKKLRSGYLKGSVLYPLNAVNVEY